MLPIVPPSMLHQLALERFNFKETRLVPNNDYRELSNVSAELYPDPAFMSLRRMFTTGPLGALQRFINRKLDERDDRRYGVPNQPSEAGSIPARDPAIFPSAPDHERDIAA